MSRLLNTLVHIPWLSVSGGKCIGVMYNVVDSISFNFNKFSFEDVIYLVQDVHLVVKCFQVILFVFTSEHKHYLSVFLHLRAGAKYTVIFFLLQFFLLLHEGHHYMLKNHKAKPFNEEEGADIVKAQLAARL